MICVINTKTRNKCKYCRFLKCERSAGLVRKYVLQQYIPKLTSQRRDVEKEVPLIQPSIETANKTSLNIGSIHCTQVSFQMINKNYLYSDVTNVVEIKIL